MLINEVESQDWKNQKSSFRPVIPALVEGQNKDGVEDIVTKTSQNQRPKKQRKVPSRFSNFEMISNFEVTLEREPINFALIADTKLIDCVEVLEEQVYKAAMLEELKSIEKNPTWELVENQAKKKAIDVKWVFKLKLNPNDTIAKHKTKLVAKGFLPSFSLQNQCECV